MEDRTTITSSVSDSFFSTLGSLRSERGTMKPRLLAFQTFSRRAANKRKDCFQGGCRSYTQELHRDKEGSFFNFESCKATVAVKSENIKSEFDRVSVSLTKCCAFLLFFCLNKCYYFYYIIIISFQKCN